MILRESQLSIKVSNSTEQNRSIKLEQKISSFHLSLGSEKTDPQIPCCFLGHQAVIGGVSNRNSGIP